MTTRSRTTVSLSSFNPRQSATSSIVGLRSTRVPRQTRTGTSSTATPNLSSVSWTASSCSTSIYPYGWLLRVRNSWSASVPAEWREPMRTTLRPPCAISARRRSMNARRKTSLSSASVWTSDRRQLEDAHGAASERAHDHRPAGQQIDVTRECTGPVHGHHVIGARQDLDLAPDDHEQRPVAIARLPQAFAVGEIALASEGSDPRDLLRGQRGEGRFLGGGHVSHDCVRRVERGRAHG